MTIIQREPNQRKALYKGRPVDQPPPQPQRMLFFAQSIQGGIGEAVARKYKPRADRSTERIVKACNGLAHKRSFRDGAAIGVHQLDQQKNDSYTKRGPPDVTRSRPDRKSTRMNSSHV